MPGVLQGMKHIQLYIETLQQPSKIYLDILIFSDEKTRLRNRKCLTQGLIASNGQSQDPNPGLSNHKSLCSKPVKLAALYFSKSQ